MCDHCAKVTSQKGYAGQVTCKCEHGEKKEEKKEEGGCCSRKNSNECTKKLSLESFSSRRIGDAREINSCEGPPQMGCCSWKQTCCGGGCCEPILPNCCNSEQKSARPLQKAMVAPAYSPWEMMNGTTLTSILGNNETEEVLCSNLPRTTTCYGGECGKTPSQNRSTRNTEETETDSNLTTIRDSDR